MFSNFGKELASADNCLHKAADAFFHPGKDDPFSKWNTKHPPFPSIKAPAPAPAPAPPSCGGKCGSGCGGKGGCCCCCCHHHHHHHTCKCNEKPPAPPPPPPKFVQIYPCFKAIDKPDTSESEWLPPMKPYTGDKIWQLHVYLPGVAKDKVSVCVLEGTAVLVHGTGKFHNHCGSWEPRIEHTCGCTRIEEHPFRKVFSLPPKSKAAGATVSFEAEVLVIRVPRG
ncbi:hypothetical protein EV182_001704 [Spiromyces aspiralis]|uniref:Uncharacterized protein n=1 Tax=Spiromyces aspiralis TaxID=68401 RepID=A0ACC1HSR5_9FUNG|nr:hypothetical protein EV182_001704 [Spiromyces aspiralis]